MEFYVQGEEGEKKQEKNEICKNTVPHYLKTTPGYSAPTTVNHRIVYIL